MTNFPTINGYRIACTTAGSSSNPPILLIHGLMSHRGVWTRTLETLKDHFFCVTFDLPGFGESDKPRDGDYSIACQAERSVQVADHFGFGAFSVIGHSMGGQIATYMAASLAPQRVSKLVSVDGVVTGKLSDRTETLNRLLVNVGKNIPAVYNLSYTLSKWKPYAQWAFKVWFNNPANLPFDSWELDRRMAMNPEISTSAYEAWGSLNATDLTHTLEKIAVPTLVIFGVQDDTVPVEQAHIFKEKAPAAQLVLIENCGHFPMYEKFDEYIAPVKEFLMKGR